MGINVNEYVDAAVLKPDLTNMEIENAILQCIEYKTKTVCVRPCDIILANKLCKGTDTEVSCVLSFPHGSFPFEVKEFEAKKYIEMGTNEIDMVVNYGYIKSHDWSLVEKDILAVSNITKPKGILLKVILETCLLTINEIKEATKIAISANADYVKTSTGFSTSGASFEAVKAMLEASEGRIKVKASGGIRDQATALEYINMGVSRLGIGYTSNQAVCLGDGVANTNY